MVVNTNLDMKENAILVSWTTFQSFLLLYVSGDDLWYNANCGEKKGFVCKKDPDVSSPVTPQPTPVVPGYCPKGYWGFSEYPICKSGASSNNPRGNNCEVGREVTT